MNATHLKSLAAGLALAFFAAPAADAAVIVTLPTASTSGSIEFTTDINFTVTADGSISSVVLDEWVENDSTRTFYPGVAFTDAISYSLNGGPISTVSFHNFGALLDNWAQNSPTITANDGALGFLVPINVAQDDLFTLKAGTYNIAAGSPPLGFNSLAAQTFTGNAYLIGSTGGGLDPLTVLSMNTAVPEPSRVLFLLSGLGLMVCQRRRAA